MTPSDDELESTTTFEPDEAMSSARFWWRVGGLLLLAALIYLVFRIVEPVWQPIAWALLLGALLAPLNARLVRRLNGRQQLASSITTVLTVLFFVLPLAGIATAFAAQAAQLLQKIESFAPRMSEVRKLDLGDIGLLEAPLAWLENNAGLTLDQIQAWLLTAARNLLEHIVSSGGSIVIGALATAVSFVLMLFVLFFVLRDGTRIARQTVALLPIAPDHRTRLWTHMLEVTRAVFMGIGLTALAQGSLVGLGFKFAGLPAPLVFGAIASLFALIPLIGTAIIWIPGAIYLAIEGHHGSALFLIAWGAIVVGMVDNFLRPMLISGRSDVPTLAVFVGVMGGLQAFGFIGLFVGPIVLALLVALFRFKSEELVVADGASGPVAAADDDP